MKKYLLLCLLILSACAAPQPANTPTSAAIDASTGLVSATIPAPSISPTSNPAGVPTATFPAPPATPEGPSYTIRVSPIDGMPQVLVPAGTLHMGGMDVFIENDELPFHDVTLKEFWIEQRE